VVTNYAKLTSPTFTGTPSLPTGTTAVTQTTGNNTTAIATTQFVQTELSNYPTNTSVVTNYAKLTSPTFTGTPSLPTGTTAVTQTTGNNTTAIATTQFVQTELSNYPTNTSVVTNYAKLTSPTFTGTPSLPTGTTAVTQTTGNNTTAIATTQFVQTELSNYPTNTSVVTNYAKLASPTFTGTVTLPNTTNAANTTTSVLLYSTQGTGGNIFIGNTAANVNISALNFTVNSAAVGSGGGSVNKDLNLSTLCVGNDLRNFSSQFALNISGGLRIYEQTGTGDLVGSNTNGTGSIGSLVISHGDSGGKSSIIFPSKTNPGSDYGYIIYRDSSTDTNANEIGRLEIGLENDYTNTSIYDCLILQKNGGYVGIGKQNPTTALDVSGEVTSTSFNTTSDYRIKTNIVDIKDTSYNLLFNRLKPVHYYNIQKNNNDFGFIAHEVKENFPLLVNGEKDSENMQTINYTGIIPLCVNEIQRLNNEIKKLNLIIEELKEYIYK
jgi:hypothetical protein